MSHPIHFWFDFSSPYSYIVNEWIDALAARHGRTVARHAMLLGVTFQAAELKSPVAHPLKREYSMRDFARSARFEGLPLEMPADFPLPTQNAARIFWWQHDTVSAEAAADWARAADRWSVIAATDFLARSFTWKLPGAATARGLGLAAFQALPPLKGWLARQMMFGRR